MNPAAKPGARTWLGTRHPILWPFRRLWPRPSGAGVDEKTNAFIRTPDRHPGGTAGEDRLPAGRRAGLHHRVQAFAKRRPVALHHFRHADREDDHHQAHDHHQLNQREGRNGCAARVGATRIHHRAMLLVMVKSACKILNSNPPTPTAMIMIIAGSIRLVITRNSSSRSFS